MTTMFVCCYNEDASTTCAEQVQIFSESEKHQTGLKVVQETCKREPSDPIHAAEGAAAAAKGNLAPKQQSGPLDAEAPPEQPQLAAPSNPVAPIATALDLPGVEYTIELSRQKGESMGLNLDLLDGVTALITVVKEEGAIAKANGKRLAADKVKAFDRIVEVNGVRGKAKSIAEMIAQSTNLTMIMRRPLQEFDVVVVKKESSTPLGVDLNYAPNSSLLILRVTDGLVQEWCDAGNRPVNAKDRIVAVNGVRGQPQQLLNQIKDASDLTLTILPFIAACP